MPPFRSYVCEPMRNGNLLLAGDYVAQRLDLQPDGPLPRTVGHVSLALALSAYEESLGSAGDSLLELFDAAVRGLRQYLEA